MIEREQQNRIESLLFSGRAILLFGARQVGKSTLLRQIVSKFASQEIITLNGDEPDVQLLLENITTARLGAIVEGKKILILDEAQMIHNAGLLIKRIVDHLPSLQVIATGSSALELADLTKEAMTGRKWEYQMFSVSFRELVRHTDLLSQMRLLPQRLIWGSYPEVITSPGKEIEILNELVDSYLYKDILRLDGIKKSSVIVRLVQLLAFQVGSEVNSSELANLLGVNRLTVEKYIDILEKSFIVFSLYSYSRNLRNELKKGRKVFFYDNGIRNAVIRKYQPIEFRDDIGKLWENYLVAERKKWLHYSGFYRQTYFWRNTQQAEIDYIEEWDDGFHAFEFKWNSHAKARISASFTNAYNPVATAIIHQENYMDWLLK